MNTLLSIVGAILMLVATVVFFGLLMSLPVMLLWNYCLVGAVVGMLLAVPAKGPGASTPGPALLFWRVASLRLQIASGCMTYPGASPAGTSRGRPSGSGPTIARDLGRPSSACSSAFRRRRR